MVSQTPQYMFDRILAQLIRALYNIVDSFYRIILEGGISDMRILVLKGSPHENGTSALLAEKFIAGAEDCGQIYAGGI